MAKKIKRYSLRNLRPYSTIVLIGGRGMGKTTIIKTIMYYNYKKIRTCMLVSATAESNGDFNGIVPNVLIYENYDSSKMKTLISDQHITKKKIKKGICPSNIKSHSYVLFDDIIGTDPTWKKDKEFKQMMFAGRHARLTNIISIQHAKALPVDYRDNIDYMIITDISSKKRKQFFHEQYWDHKYGNYKTFEKYYNSIKSKHKYNFILIDKKAAGKDISEYMFYGRAPSRIPRKKVGLKAYWDINKFYNQDYLLESFTKDQDENIIDLE